MKHIVTSSDGVQLLTNSDERTVAFDQKYASTHPADWLEAQGDFIRLCNVYQDALVAPEPRKPTIGSIIGPPVLTLIKGGKS
jgi:hypothetical protein